MMGKIFNKKTAKVYIAMICISLVIALVSSGFCISYSAQLKKIAEENASSNSTLSSLGSALVSLLGGDDKAATESLEGVVSSLITGNSGEDKVVKVSDEEKALGTKKTITLVMLIVFYVLTVVFFAGTIVSYEYEKYLESPKYKAKVKRLQKYEKIKNK